MSDPVRQYLRDKMCAPHVISGGLEGLIEAWEKTVESVEHGYQLGLDDYLNDMDGRQLIEEVLTIDSGANSVKYGGRLRRADERMKKITRRRANLWGDDVAAANHWTPGKNWWYFREPEKAGQELLNDLNRESR